MSPKIFLFGIASLGVVTTGIYALYISKQQDNKSGEKIPDVVNNLGYEWNNRTPTNSNSLNQKDTQGSDDVATTKSSDIEKQ